METFLRVTGPLCGEFTGLRWSPHTMTSIIYVWQRRSWLLASTFDQPPFLTPCPWSRLNPTSKTACVCLQQGPPSCHKIMVSNTFTKSKTIFQIEMYCMQCFLKSKYIKCKTFNETIGELLRKLWSLRSSFLILPPGALTPQGIDNAMKPGDSNHWCTLQRCASRGWFIGH